MQKKFVFDSLKAILVQTKANQCIEPEQGLQNKSVK